MKKIFKEKKQILGLIAFSLIVFIGCSKKEQSINEQPIKTPKLSKTIKGGCFVGKSDNPSDTIYYEVNNDTLLLHVTVNKNCSSSPLDSLIINQGNVNIYIKDQNASIAYCTCAYQFTYLFTNFNTIQSFNVFYKDFSTTNYTLWNSMTFP